jgi:hypothetical protein
MVMQGCLTGHFLPVMIDYNPVLQCKALQDGYPGTGQTT